MPLLHAVVNGTFEKRSTPLTEEKASVPLPGLCKLLPDNWFGSNERFRPCLDAQDAGDDSRPISIVHFLGECANPLEWIVFWAIIAGIVS